MESIPEVFIKRITSRYSTITKDTITYIFCKKPVSIRVNTIKTMVQNVTKQLDDLAIPYEKISWYQDAFLLPTATSKKITETHLYKDGKIYIQSLSSMLPALVLNPQSGERVLDMSAAPGSKTTQMAMMMKNEGEILANDIDSNRIYRLKSVLANQGVTNTITSRFPGQSLWTKYPEYFDKVLLDAPCSMEGKFDATDPKTYSHWSLKKVRNLSKLQRWMLRSAVSATKVGGTIVYSTCTLSPEENEEVIDWILEKEKDNIIFEKIELQNLSLTNGYVLPSSTIEGFFVAKLKKIKSNIV
ncbi:RsmB/NOP family class I SAM-dependent RNA methyltransferase [Candidatus Roizmanbacteria bacterium]|nr:RsmB/NOP family class I SAM-dependent RNA methyltransferase [Candidatus Roizmanbacteria bacterium]